MENVRGTEEPCRTVCMNHAIHPLSARLLLSVPATYLQVPLHLVEDVLAGATQQDGARLGLLTVGEEGEVLVAHLLDLKQPCAGAHVTLLQLLHAVRHGGAGGAGNAVVVGLAQAADGRDARPAGREIG